MSDDLTRADPGAAPPQPASPAGQAPAPAAEPGNSPATPATPSVVDAMAAADPGSPVALLQALAQALPPDAIDELWIFSPRRIGPAQSTVIVASAFEAPSGKPASASAATAEDAEVALPAERNAPGPPAEDLPEAAPDRRRIITARFTVAGDPRSRVEVQHELAEHGAAPSARVGRVVDGVLRRLEDEPEPPRYARIAGEVARWTELLEELARAQH